MKYMIEKDEREREREEKEGIRGEITTLRKRTVPERRDTGIRSRLNRRLTCLTWIPTSFKVTPPFQKDTLTSSPSNPVKYF